MKKAKPGTRTAKTKGRTAPKTVDEYFARIPEPGRSTLNKIRAAIRSAAPPDAVETISYGIPALKHKKVLVWFAAFSNHCSFFPTAAVIDMFREELQGYTISKGTIQFSIDKPLPASLVKKMVRARVAHGEG